MSLPATVGSEQDPEEADPSGFVGRVLDGRYEVTGLLGVGGIGRVYRAQHLVLKRPVALKVLLEHYQCVPDLQRRFEREAMALAALSHPNIVTITDFVSNKEATFLVMELVEGRDLDDILDEDGPMPPAEAFDVMEQVLGCLAYAHDRDVIHRDLKPQNVMVRRLAGGRLHAVVLDFGLAKFMDGSGPSANLTKTGLVIGTPAYMAPEQASGGHADRRADVYAAGIMFYEMLAGEHPFEGFEGSELLRQHLLTPAPSLASKCPDTEVSPALETFLARALAKDGTDRFADGAAMLDAFLELPAHAFVRGAAAPKPERLHAEAPTVVAARPVATAAPAPAATAGRSRLPALLSALVLAAGFAAIGIFVLTQGRAPEPELTHAGAGAPTTSEPAPPSEPPTEPLAADPIAAEPAGTNPEPVEDPDAVPDADEEDSESDEDLDAEADAPLEDDEGEDAEPAPPPRESRPAARNPWRGRTPEPLDRIRRRVSRGHSITKRHVREVARYRRRNPSDVRATLVLAQVYMARGWLSSALAQYERAYRRDPSSRGDSRMRNDLVRLVRSESVHADATDALVEIYGDEAASTLRGAIRRERDPDARGRLEAALARAAP